MSETATATITAEIETAEMETATVVSPRFRPKYYHQLCPQPLDIPEVLSRVQSLLSKKDIKKCMLICSIWAKCFGPFLWETIHFNRFSQQNDIGLQRNGRLIKKLYTYSLRDRDLVLITRDCPNLTQLDLDIDCISNGNSLFNMFYRINGIQKLKIRLLNPHDMGNVQRAVLKPITLGLLSHLTELRLNGSEDRKYAPIYQTGMIIRCLEGCPFIQLLELSALRVVDTIEQWDDMEQKFFTNSGLPLVAKARPFGASTSSWFNWAKMPSKPKIKEPPAMMIATPRISTDRTRQIIRGADLNHPYTAGESEDKGSLEDINPLSKISPPNEDYKCKHLTTIKLRDLYAASPATPMLVAFVSALLKKSPNLAHLSIKSIPADIELLSTMCPKLRILDIENPAYDAPFPNPNVVGFLINLSLQFDNSVNSTVDFGSPVKVAQYISSDALNLRRLRSLRLSRCSIEDEHLLGLPDEFKRSQLKNLELHYCAKISSLGCARFLAQCWSLETVWIDGLLLPVNAGQKLVSRSSVFHGSDNNNNSNGIKPSARDSRAINWECNQIRYLDVYGSPGCEESFEHIFLDMVARLDVLEFLGMSTSAVAWLMKHEPVRYSILESNPPIEIPIPPVVFGSIKTLSLEACNRVNSYYTPHGYPILTYSDVKYLHDAFPALEKIVYSGNTFPITAGARDWLLKTPRKIEVLHRSKEEVATAVLEP